MRVLIAGSSGFLGTRLSAHLREAGHTVHRLVRGEATGPEESRWDPYAGEIDAAEVAAADVVINLAGSPTAGNPHSRTWARELERSRVRTTHVLAEAIAAAPSPPAFLAGNGISWYGDHGDQPLPETADSRGDALLTRVTRAWQAATEPAAEAGARVVVLRTAPVLDRANPPLKQQWLQFKAGLGGRLGDGRQYFPCLGAEDWVRAVTFLAEGELVGPVNLCLPQVPTNAEYTEALADLVGRPAFAHVPAFLIRRAAGALAQELLGSVRAVPQALIEAGFEFAHPDITATLRAASASHRTA